MFEQHTGLQEWALLSGKTVRYERIQPSGRASRREAFALIANSRLDCRRGPAGLWKGCN